MILFEICVEQGWVMDGVISQSEVQVVVLWCLREGISEMLVLFMFYKNDVLVMVLKVLVFLQEIDEIVNVCYLDFEIVWFGYIGDGNLYLNILKLDVLDKVEFFICCESVNMVVFEMVQKYGGSVLVEYGVGMIKKFYLYYM